MDANKIYKILSDIKKGRHPLSLYTLKFDELIKVDTWISELNPKDIKLGFLKKRFNIIEVILGSREEVFLYSEESRIALFSKFLKTVDNEIHLSFPDQSAVSDLRQGTRLDMDLKLEVKFNGKNRTFDTFDIGYNDLSIIVKENKARY